jgi:GH35 family endo-1,4-beta-xylanase
MYSGFDLTGIRGIVEEIEHSEAPWRKKARERIERYRKARMTIQTLDSNGMPAPGVEVSIKLLRHAFHFGGVITVNAFSRNEAAHKKAFSEMGFNSAGFCNSLKYKLNKGKGKKNVKDIIKWLRSKNIYVRGHCLIWPGCGHLPSSISKIVRAKQQDKRKLEETCAAMIAEWAAQWDVDEWDVINEPRGNHDVQDILGYGVEKQWFDIARKHVKNGKKVRLCFNDNRIISDSVKNGRETLTDRVLKYRANLERLIQEKAPLDFLGFQSRFATKIPPEIIYERLRVFDKYKLPLVATEFEMRNSIGTEEEKAKYTAVVMTVYFSHPLVDGIYAWSLSPRNDKREIMNADGSPNLRGKIWLYLTKNRWSTRTILTTGPDGKATTKAFKGTYEIKAKLGNKETTIETNLEDDKTLTIKL